MPFEMFARGTSLRVSVWWRVRRAMCCV